MSNPAAENAENATAALSQPLYSLRIEAQVAWDWFLAFRTYFHSATDSQLFSRCCTPTAASMANPYFFLLFHSF